MKYNNTLLKSQKMGQEQSKVDPKGTNLPLQLTSFLEQMRQHKRMMDRAARKIERERGKMEQQEKKHIKEITKLAKQGQHVSS